jgi:phospholipid-binding lipoprotein MlaA
MKIMKNDIFLIMFHILVYNLIMSPIKFKNFFSVLTVSLAVILSFALALNAKNAYSSDDDPLEPINRAIFGFNEVIDDAVLEPVAKGYRAITPDPVEDSVSNFFNNLGEINNIFNSALQLKLDKTVSSSARFAINSTLGVFGFFDIASRLGIERHREDFGQTLGYYGVPAGPYLVLPFFGPSTFRDAPGFYADIAVEKSISPVHTELHHEERQLIQAANVIDTRAELVASNKNLRYCSKR